MSERPVPEKKEIEPPEPTPPPPPENDKFRDFEIDRDFGRVQRVIIERESS
jgi:hypothetical protein